MNIALMPQRPPYVVFEQRAVEDRNASIQSGGLKMRDVDYVVVTGTDLGESPRDGSARVLIAVRIDDVRLIDNAEVSLGDAP